MPTFLAVLLSLALPIVCGAGVLMLVWKRRHPLEAEWWLPLAFLLGWMVRTVVALTMMLVAGRYDLAVFPVLAPLVFVAGWRQHGPGVLGRSWLVDDLLRRDRWRWLRAGLVALVVLRCLVLFEEAGRMPLFGFDGRAIWEFKGRILLHEETALGPAFVDPERAHFHRDYPLMWPLAIAELYWLAGDGNTAALRLLASSLGVLWLLLLYGILRRRGNSVLALFVTTLGAGLLFRFDHGEEDGLQMLSGTADFPLCLATTAAFGLLAEALRRGRREELVAAAVAAAACVLLKAEGVLAVAAFPVGVVAMRASRVVAEYGWLLAAPVLTMLVLLAPWLLLKRRLPNFYDERYTDTLDPELLPKLAERAPLVFRLVFDEMRDRRTWELLWYAWPALVLACALARVRSGARAVEIPVLVLLGGYLVAFLISPLHIIYHVDTASGRLLSHVQGLVLVAIGLRLRALWLRHPRAWRLGPAAAA